MGSRRERAASPQSHEADQSKSPLLLVVLQKFLSGPFQRGAFLVGKAGQAMLGDFLQQRVQFGRVALSQLSSRRRTPAFRLGNNAKFGTASEQIGHSWQLAAMLQETNAPEGRSTDHPEQ